MSCTESLTPASPWRLWKSSSTACQIAPTQGLDQRGIALAADRREAGNAADGVLAFVVVAAQQQVGDAFFGEDVGHVLAVDHDRRQLHARLLGERPGIEAFDERRLHVL